MKVQEWIDSLKPYSDFELIATVHLEVAGEELQKRLYRYPYDDYRAELRIGDIGHSDKVVHVDVEIADE